MKLDYISLSHDTNYSILGSTNYHGKAIRISRAGSQFGSWREDGLGWYVSSVTVDKKKKTKLDNLNHSKQQHKIFLGFWLKQTFFKNDEKYTLNLIQYLKCKGSLHLHHWSPLTQCTQTTNIHFLKKHIAQLVGAIPDHWYTPSITFLF